MGEVYRARDTKLDREVAIKILRHDFAADPERLRRFQLEAHAASSLSHPSREPELTNLRKDPRYLELLNRR